MNDESKESDATNLAQKFAAATTTPKKPAPSHSFSLVDTDGNPNHIGALIAPVAPIFYGDCRTCCEPNPNGRMTWKCSCGLRGDLATNDPTNEHLARCRIVALQQESALAQAKVQASIRKSSNDSSSDADSTVASAVEALDRLYEKELKVGPPYPLFGGLTRSREAAYNGLAYHPPSDQLVALIQSGKFWKIGHAIPRPLVYDTGDDGATLASLRRARFLRLRLSAIRYHRSLKLSSARSDQRSLIDRRHCSTG